MPRRRAPSSIAILVSASVLMYGGCSDKVEQPPTPSPGRVLSATSFEFRGSPTFGPWTPYASAYLKSSYYDVNAVPSVGGRWAVEIDAGGDAPDGLLMTKVTGLGGTGSIEVTGWSKGSPTVSIDPVSDSLPSRSIVALSPTWERFFLADTLTLKTSDTVWVTVSPPAFGRVLFDSARVVARDFEDYGQQTTAESLLQIRVDLQTGFRGDFVQVVIDGEEVYADTTTSDLSTGFADGAFVELASGVHSIVATVDGTAKGDSTFSTDSLAVIGVSNGPGFSFFHEPPLYR